MINIDFYASVALYMGGIIGVALVVWIAGRKERNKELSLDSRFIWFCSICSYTYVNTREEVISLCPRCGSYNKKVDTASTCL